MKERIRNIISLLLNVIVVITLICVMCYYFLFDSNSATKGIRCLVYYTTDSNLLFAASCLLMIPFNILTLIKKENKIPQYITAFKFFGTTTVTITFLVVIFILGPAIPTGFLSLYTETQLYLHLLVPLIAIISFIFVDLYNPLETKHLVYNLVPTLIYTICYMVMVLGNKQVDVYQFLSHGLFVGILTGILIVSSSFFIGMLFRFLFKIRNKKYIASLKY